jgi:hypothetical protein
LKLHAVLRAEHGRNLTPSAISQGIEALGCKLALSREDAEATSDRIIGRRAFARSPDAWDFASLRRSSHYVINTHRQVATRALRVDGGLGLASGQRFNSLTLEPIGESLADAFLQQVAGRGGISLRNWLVGWLLGERDLPDRPDALCQALSPETPSREEKTIVRGRLLDISNTAGATRRNLGAAIGNRRILDIEGGVIANLRKSGHQDQADHITVARAFGMMLDRARDATALFTRQVEGTRDGIPASQLAEDQSTKPRLRALQTSASHFLKTVKSRPIDEYSSRAFASAIAEAEHGRDIVRRLVSATPLLLQMAGNRVIRGPQFRLISSGQDTESDAEEAPRTAPDADFTDRTFRISNFHELLTDCRAFADARAA